MRKIKYYFFTLFTGHLAAKNNTIFNLKFPMSTERLICTLRNLLNNYCSISFMSKVALGYIEFKITCYQNFEITVNFNCIVWV